MGDRGNRDDDDDSGHSDVDSDSEMTATLSLHKTATLSRFARRVILSLIVLPWAWSAFLSNT